MVPNSCQKASGLHGVPVPHIQAPALSSVRSPPLSAPLLPQSPPCPSVSPTSFLVTSPPSARFSCSALRAFSPSAPPSPLFLAAWLLSSVCLPSPAWVLLSRTVWKAEKPSWGVGRRQPPRKGPGLLWSVRCHSPQSQAEGACWALRGVCVVRAPSPPRTTAGTLP